jgi:hypothetical protein
MNLLWKVLVVASEKVGGLFPRFVKACLGLYEHKATSKTRLERLNYVFTSCYLLAKRKPIIYEPVKGHDGEVQKLEQCKTNNKNKDVSTVGKSKLDYLFFYTTKQDPPISSFMCRNDYQPEIKEVKITGSTMSDDRKPVMELVQHGKHKSSVSEQRRI